jgi:hypothetical protein
MSVYVSKTRKAKEWKPTLIYNGFGGPLCPGCDTPIGEKHLKGCEFLKPPKWTWTPKEGDSDTDSN